MRLATMVLWGAALLATAGCSKSSPSGSPATAPITLNAAGSTFVYPMMSKWSSEYQKLNPAVQVNYQSIGSGGGIRQLIARTVQIGATDGPMTDDQLKEAKSPVIHIPLVMGAVVPTYNLPSLAHALQFTPEALAGIYLGQIKTWNDPAIASANADLKLPATAIVVAHRSDGSGTTYVWVDYLSKVSPEWKTKVGTATSVNWPVGVGGKGNEGVAGTVQQTPGAIGYVELTYALQNKMPVGHVKNQAGKFVEPTIASVTSAAAGALATIPEESQIFHHELARRDGIPDKRYDLGGRVSGHAGRTGANGGRGIPSMGPSRRPEVLRCPRLRAVAGRACAASHREAGPGGARGEMN